METYQPELEIRKAHDVRRLQGCQCGGLGMRDQMVKIDGDYWHGRCAIARFGLERVAALPLDVVGGLRLDDIGREAAKAMIDARAD